MVAASSQGQAWAVGWGWGSARGDGGRRGRTSDVHVNASSTSATAAEDCGGCGSAARSDDGDEGYAAGWARSRRPRGVMSGGRHRRRGAFSSAAGESAASGGGGAGRSSAQASGSGGVVAPAADLVGADSYSRSGGGGFAIRGRRRGASSSSPSSSSPSSSSPSSSHLMMMSVSRANAAERDARATPSTSRTATGESLPGPGNVGGGNHGGRKTFLRLTAGVMSTTVVRTLLAPFERVKLEYLLNRSKLALGPQIRQIFAAEGIKGFWRGNGINLLRVCPYKAINFAAFDAFRGFAVMMSPGGPHDVNKVLLAVAGASAGVASVSSCFPMDVVRTRLLVTGGMTKYGGLRACISTLYRTQGLGAFYRGFLPAIISMAPNGAVYYTVYDRLKMHRLRQLEEEVEAAAAKFVGGKCGGGSGGGSHATAKNGKREGTGTGTGTGTAAGGTRGTGGGDAGDGVAPIRVEQGYMMLFGAMAGVASEFSMYPLEVVRRRMQLQGGTSSMSNVVGVKAIQRMAVTLRVIVKQRGLGGLYVGCIPSCMQVLPSAAFGYYSYEMFKILLNVD